MDNSLITHFHGQISCDSPITRSVPNPNNPNSQSLMTYHSVLYAANQPIDASGGPFILYLPAGVAIESFFLVVTDAFDGTTPTVQVGSTPGASDLLAPVAIDTPGAASYGCASPTGFTALYFTIVGSPTVGSGYVAVRYTG
jgi:hypothetical protein